MVETRRAHTAEFKLEAVHLAEEHDVTLTSVARDLDVLESLLRKWVRDHRTKGTAAFPGSGQRRLSVKQVEIKRLKRENEILR